MGKVPLADILPYRDLKHFGAAARELVDQRRVRVRAEAIEIAVVEEPLKPAVDAVAAFVGEELEELRRRDQSEVVNGAKEFAVSRLERERRLVGAFGPGESRKTTTERSLSLSGG